MKYQLKSVWIMLFYVNSLYFCRDFYRLWLRAIYLYFFLNFIFLFLRMKRLTALFVMTLAFLVISWCWNVKDTETINQVSLLQWLTLGDYYGSKSIKELKELWNIWLGTFDGLNGELIMLDWVVYRGNDKLEIEVPSDDELIPFANVTFFDNDLEYELSDIDSIEELKEELDDKVSELGENRFYFVALSWEFNSIHIRSERKQEEDYKPLAEVLRVDQTEKKLDSVEWTIVAFFTPAYMADLNAAWWHFHFVSKDRKTWGHVLDLSIKDASVILDWTDNFKLYLPDWEFFKGLDLTVDQSSDIKEVEQGK